MDMPDYTRDQHGARERRFAMYRVFGGTALAFLALLIVAVLVRPDIMQAAMEMVVSVMH